MSYRVRYTMPDGRTGHWKREYATREEAQKAIDDRRGYTGLASYVEEVPGAPEPGSTAAHHVKPAIGVMPRRVWEEQCILALAEAIVRRIGHGEPTVASVFDLAHIHDWAAEIVELCERHGGQDAKPSEAEAIRRLEADNRELRNRLAVAQRQRDEAVAALAKEQRP